MEQLNTPPRQPILSIQETVALMAKRPGITVGGGIERNTPNPDPRAAEPPTNEDDVVVDYRMREWWQRQSVIDKASEAMRKKASGVGEKYVKPRLWTAAEKAKLLSWRRQYGETTGTGVSGKMNPQRLGA